MTITRRQGSFTLEESLAQLVKAGLVDRQDALGARRAPGGTGAATRAEVIDAGGEHFAMS